MISIKFKVEEAPMKIKGSGWQGDVQNNFIIVSRLQSYYSSTIFLSNISLISPRQLITHGPLITQFIFHLS